jgi:small ligand-binding sensory domain FIST
VASEAAGEVVGAVLEAQGPGPDLVVLTVTRHHAGALEDIGATVDAALRPRAIVGAAAESVVAAGTQIEEGPGISLWAGRLGDVADVAVGAHRGSDDGWRFTGWPAAVDFEPGALLLLADPYTFPVTEFLQLVEASHPGLPVVGGLTSGGLGPGASRLLLGRRVASAGAVGILLSAEAHLEPLVSQGCQPYGRTLTVTRSEGNVVGALAGQPALDCLVEQARAALTPEQVAAIGTSGVHLGRLVDERVVDPGPGDLLVRTVVGVDRSSRAIALDDRVPLGSTVRFCRRDATTARADLLRLLDDGGADGALAFLCVSRGGRYFPPSRRDTATIERSLGPVPVGGMLSGGEIGPVGGRNFALTNSATLALFREP